MRDNSGAELDPAVDDCRRCKNSLFVLSSIGKRTKDLGSKVGTVHSERGGKGHFLRGNRRILAKMSRRLILVLY